MSWAHEDSLQAMDVHCEQDEGFRRGYVTGIYVLAAGNRARP